MFRDVSGPGSDFRQAVRIIGRGQPWDTVLVSRKREFWFLGFSSTAALVAVYLLFSQTTLGGSIDDAALAGRSITPGRILDSQFTILDVVGLGSLTVAIAVLVGIAAVRRRGALALAVAVIIVGANATTQILKAVLPASSGPGIAGLPPTNSFPSGHATIAMSIAVTLVLVTPARLRWLSALLGSGYAAATGVAVLTVGWHRPSDAVGAWLVVGAWTGIVLAFLAGAERIPVVRPVRRTAVWTIGFLTALVLMAVGTVVAGYLAVDTWFTGDAYVEVRRAAAFTTGSAAIAGSAAALVGVLLTMLRGVEIGAADHDSTWASDEDS